MTICIASFNPDQIIFCSDQFRSQWRGNFLDRFFEGKIKLDHRNIRNYIQKVSPNNPKILKIGKHTTLMRGGDVRLNKVTENLETTKPITQQIIERLQKIKITPSIWACEIGYFTNHCSVDSITYNNGKIEKQHQIIGQSINTLSEEIVGIFQRKYATKLWFAKTLTKITVLKEFFEEISNTFNGYAGGKPIIAEITKKGFRYL